MTIAGSLVIGVTADMDKFNSQVASGATAAGQAASGAVSNTFTRGLIANADKVKAAGQKMTLGVTAPLALIGTLAVRSAGEFESSMSQTAAALNKPMSGMQSLEKLALELGQSTVFSAGEVSASMTELAKGGFSAAEIKAGALKSTLDLAAAGGLDLTSAAKGMTAAMNSFGIPASESVVIADALAGAANASAADVSDLNVALAQVATVAAGSNQSLQETTGFLAAMADAGIKGSDAGTSLKTMLMRLAAPTGTAAAMLDKYNIATRDSKGNMLGLAQLSGQLYQGLRKLTPAQRDAALQTIFGADALRAARIAYKQGEAGIRGYIQASSKAGAADKAAQARMGPTQRALEELSGAWETLMVQVGKDLAPTVSAIAGVLKGLTEAFSGLPDSVRKGAVALGALAAAAGPVLVAVGSLAGAVGKLKAFRTAAAAACGATSAPLGGCLGGGKGGKGGGLSAVPATASRAGTSLTRFAGLARGALRFAGPAAIAVVLTEIIQLAQNYSREMTEAATKTKGFKDAWADAKNLKNPVDGGAPTGNAGMAQRVQNSEMVAAAIITARLNGSIQKLRASETAYTQSLQAGNSVINQRNAGTLRGTALTTAAKTALQGQVTAAHAFQQQQVASGASAADMARSVISQKNAFMQQAVAMGFSVDQAQVLAKQYGLVPKDVKTQIKAINAEQTQAKVTKIDSQLERLKAKRTAIRISGKDPETKKKELDDLDKKVNALNRKKARIQAEAKGVDKSINQVDKLSGKVKGLKDKDIQVQADTAQADTKIKDTERLLKDLESNPFQPEVKVKDDAQVVASNVTSTLGSIPDETVNINYNLTTSGSPPKGGEAPPTGVGYSAPPSGGVAALSSSAVAPMGAVAAFAVGGKGNNKAPSPPKPDPYAWLPSKEGLRNAWANITSDWMTWWSLDGIVQKMSTGWSRAYENQALQSRRAAEDEDQRWAEAQDKIARRWTRYKQQGLQNKQSAENKASNELERERSQAQNKYTNKDGKKVDGFKRKVNKEIADEKKVLARKRKARRRYEREYDDQQVTRDRQRQRLERERARQREDDELAASRAREDAEEAVRQELERREEAARVEQEEADRRQAEADERKAANESVTASILAQRDALRDSMKQSVQWTSNPASLIRNLNKTKGIFANYSQDLQRLQAHGLSKEAMAAMSQMNPKDAAKLAARLVANPALIGQLNDAYAGLIDQSTGVANRYTAAQFEGVGAGMTDGILAGLQGGEAGVLAYITGLAQESLDAIKKTLGISSPSKAFAEVGEDIGLGLAVGVSSTERLVSRRVDSLVSIPARSAPPTATVNGVATGGITQNIYPTPGMSERDVATASARELAWTLGL